jgi:hypothetical protein
VWRVACGVRRAPDEAQQVWRDGPLEKLGAVDTDPTPPALRPPTSGTTGVARLAERTRPAELTGHLDVNEPHGPNDVRSIIAVLGGMAVVARRATTAKGTRKLQLELQRLRAAQHPGVVQVVAGLAEPGAGYATRWLGGRSLATVTLAPTEAVAVVARVAATLADLHARGIAHGRLSPARVLLGEADAPVLAGLGDGARLDGAPAEPADDVAQVGQLVVHVLEGCLHAEPIPNHRLRARPPASEVLVVRSAHLLADQACHEEADRRPTMAQLARSLATVAGGPSSSRGARSLRLHLPPAAGRSVPRVAEVGLVAMLVATALLTQRWWWRWLDGRAGAAVIPWFATQPAVVVAMATLQGLAAMASVGLLVTLGWRRHHHTAANAAASNADGSA